MKNDKSPGRGFQKLPRVKPGTPTVKSKSIQSVYFAISLDFLLLYPQKCQIKSGIFIAGKERVCGLSSVCAHQQSA